MQALTTFVDRLPKWLLVAFFAAAALLFVLAESRSAYEDCLAWTRAMQYDPKECRLPLWKRL